MFKSQTVPKPHIQIPTSLTTHTHLAKVFSCMEKVFKIAITCLCLLSHPYRNIAATARPAHYRVRDVLKLQMNHKAMSGGGGGRQSRWWSEEDYALPHRRIPMHNELKP